MPDSHSHCIPAELAADTVESLYATHGPARSIIYWLMLGGLLAGLIALPLIKVDVSVRAAGLVRPTTDLAELRTSVAGHVAEVFVANNAAVHAEQPLLRLEAPDLEQRLARNHTEQTERAAIVADLLQLTAPPGLVVQELPGVGLPATAFRPPSGMPFNPRSVGRDRAGDGHPVAPNPPTQIEPRTALIRQEWAQFRARTETYRLAESKARGELARFTHLASKGIATQQELENARYEVERLESENTLLWEQARAQWQNRLREERTLLETLRTEERRLLAEQRLYTLQAPVDGVLVGFTGIGPRRLVLAGQVLGTLSPTDALRIEAYVTPQDIGLIRVGQRARIQVDAFPYTQWGTIEGVVESISDDILTATSGGSGQGDRPSRVFVAKVRPFRDALRLSNGAQGQLKKGMTLSVRFITARRNLLQILYESASRWIDPTTV